MALVGAGQKIRGAFTAGRVHAHVERPVETEAEAALGRVDLRRRDAQIEEQTVDAIHPERRQRRHELAESGVMDGKTGVTPQVIGLRGEHRLGIAIERQQAPGRCEPLQDGA